MTAKSVVVDTNVIISALLGSSYPKRIVAAWISGQIHVVMDAHLKHELNDVVRRPKIKMALKSKSFGPINSIIGTLINQAQTVTSKPLAIRSFKDEKDHFLLELAVSSKAVAIVTGDDELLAVKRIHGVQILDPKEFCEKFWLS